MSNGYITANNVIVVSGYGSVDYAVTFARPFPTERADMDVIAQRVNAFGAQAFGKNVRPRMHQSFTHDSKTGWTVGASSGVAAKIVPALQITLNELASTLLANQTASYIGVTKNPRFTPLVRNDPPSPPNSSNTVLDDAEDEIGESIFTPKLPALNDDEQSVEGDRNFFHQSVSPLRHSSSNVRSAGEDDEGEQMEFSRFTPPLAMNGTSNQQVNGNPNFFSSKQMPISMKLTAKRRPDPSNEEMKNGYM